MKSSSRTILSRFALLASIAASPLFMTDAQAFGGKPGGPFGNGSYFPNDGTFSAVLRGTDLVGTLQFSTGSAGSSGTAVIYSDGDHYFGNSSGVFNPSENEIAVQFQAESPGLGQQTFILTDPAVATREFAYYDSLYSAGSAICKTSNDFPNQKFSGTGEATFQYLGLNATTNQLEQNIDTKAISVTGVRISNTANAFSSVTVTPPSIRETAVTLP